MINKRTAVLIVSHSSGTIQSMCNRVVWLEKGQVKEIGSTAEVLEIYINI